MSFLRRVFGGSLPQELADDLRAAEGARDDYKRTGDQAALDAAVAAWSRMLEHKGLASAPDRFRLAVLNNGGIEFLRRYWAHGSIHDLDRSLDLWKQAVAATPPDAADRPARLSNFGCGLFERYKRTAQSADVDGAIRAYQQAVNCTAADAPGLPSILTNLGVALRWRYARTRRKADLDDAIRVSQQAVQTMPLDAPEQPICLANLGLAMRDRFHLNGQREDLEEAIRLSQKAVAAIPRNSPALPAYLDDLGEGLRVRFERTGEVADLEAAIRAFEEALAATPLGAPDRAGRLGNLGLGLSARFERTGQAADLEAAIEAHQQAVAAAPPESPERPGHLNNLGTGLSRRFARSGQAADLEAAIRAFEQAVAATPPESPDRPGRLNNLGNGLRDRFARTGEAADLEVAISVYRRACELGTVSAPQAVLAAARNWGSWAVARRQWNETAEACGFGLATGRQLLARQLAREHKESWLRDLQEMAAPAAYARAKLGEVEEAAATIERGRARLLAEALERTRRDLKLLPARGHEDLYRRYREIVATQERLQQPAGPAQPDALQGQARLDAIITATRALEAVVAEIRQVPGYADFLADPTFTQLQAAAPDTPVVYLLATAAGGLALVVDAGTVQPVWFDGLTDAVVREWLMGPADEPALGGWLGAYQEWLVERTPAAHHAWLAAVDAITQELWSHLMGPLAAALHERLPSEVAVAPSVTLIPAGLLALLPLHAAWTADASTPTGRRYFLDDFTVSYAPSALALRHVREGASTAPADRLLAVEDPLASGVQHLPNAPAEVAAIASLFDAPTVLAHDRATRAAVRAVLPQAHVVHFACHGSNNWENPLASGLLLADEKAGTAEWLTVQDLLDTKDAAGRLATLSACETGLVGTDLPDEVVALPSALLQVGFEGVAASLWSVPDISTAMLMEHFYRGWRADGLAPARALRAAQRWVRDTTNREKAEYFQRYSSALQHPAPAGSPLPGAAAITFYTQAMTRPQDRRDFAHPIWWAAFYLTGV